MIYIRIRMPRNLCVLVIRQLIPECVAALFFFI